MLISAHCFLVDVVQPLPHVNRIELRGTLWYWWLYLKRNSFWVTRCSSVRRQLSTRPIVIEITARPVVDRAEYALCINGDECRFQDFLCTPGCRTDGWDWPRELCLEILVYVNKKIHRENVCLWMLTESCIRIAIYWKIYLIFSSYLVLEIRHFPFNFLIKTIK